jgi:hypothetical protein
MGERRVKYSTATKDILHAKCGELAIKCGHTAPGMANIIKVRFGYVCQNVLSRLNEAPYRPHGMG